MYEKVNKLIEEMGETEFLDNLVQGLDYNELDATCDYIARMWDIKLYDEDED